MAVESYRSPKAPGHMFIEGLLGGAGSALGQQAGKGISSLVGSGLEKLTGLGGPGKEQIDFLVNQGLSPEEAEAFYKLEPRAQQQFLANIGQKQQQKKTSDIYSPLAGKEPEAKKELSDDELIKMLVESGVSEEDMNKLLAEREKGKGEEGKIKPRFMETPSEKYSELIAKGSDPKLAKEYAAAYRNEYKEAKDKVDEYVSGIKTESKSAKENNQRLDRYYELVKKGDLPPATVGALQKTLEKGIGGFGIDLSNFLGADAQEAQKLSADFIKGAKNVFGNRMTNLDVETWLKTVPGLSQSDEGKLRNINNLRIMNEAMIITNKAMKDVIRENKGKVPMNLQELVEDKVGDKLDGLYEKFKKGESVLPGYEKAVEKARKRSEGETPGSLAGGLAGAALGRTAGSALGSFGGPIGTVLGGLAGGALGSYAPQALRSAQEGSRALEEKLGVPDVASNLRQLIGLGPIQR